MLFSYERGTPAGDVSYDQGAPVGDVSYALGTPAGDVDARARAGDSRLVHHQSQELLVHKL